MVRVREGEFDLMRWMCVAANRLWRAAAWADDRRFRSALSDPARAQRMILRRYVENNRETVFGRAHHFSRIDSIERLRDYVPLSTWDDYGPLVDQIRAGEQHVLTQDRVQRLVPSSGSTRAAKLIPYTASLRREFNAAISPWIADLYRHNPGLMNGPAYWSITPAMGEDARYASAVPVGFGEDSEYLLPILRPLVESTLAVPARARHLRQMDAFRDETNLHLLAARELRLISVWHPSFLMLLLDAMEGRWLQLVDELRRRGYRRRAEELSKISPRDYAAIWPRLGLISAWGDAHAALDLDALRHRWPDVAIQKKGLLATEAFVTISYGSRHPLALRSHFFEFIDEQDERVFLPHELRSDAVYRVVVTTAGGLYRYQLHDRVKVTGWLGATPSLEFLGKADHVSDRFGEKLSEGFAGEVIGVVLRQFGISARFAMLAPQRVLDGTRYALFLQSSPTPRLNEMAAALDRALSENPHYAYCRRLNQLLPAAVTLLGGDAYETYTARLVAMGQRLGNIKSMALSALDDWESVFTLLPPD